ncbi:valine--tRNA ligase [Candidatus Woesearchaeota archaeon]|nr:valine--tRNA ligase [Candidatus Woesearchaeota archaeon]
MNEPKLAEKAWSKDFEAKTIAAWRKAPWAFNPKTKRRVYSIDTPPPYVNAPVHMGHASSYSMMDFFARYKRMTGHDVLFPLGLDRNGLPIEVAAEKKSGKKFNMLPREEFLKLCKQVLEEASATSVDTFAKLGISFNSWNVGTKLGDIYHTDSPEYRASTQATFIDLWKKGLIYEADRVNNYCPGCQTTIADSEIDYEDIPTLFSDIKWKIKETNEEVVIGTTRPEFLGSCAMVIYNPADDRYKHLEGKHAIIPLYNRVVPIKAHPYAQMDKGTGLVMMCAFGDQTDVRFFREQNLEPRILIGIDGRMNEHAGSLKGLKVKQGREKILEELKAAKLVASQRQITHRTPICSRSRDHIEFIGMKEFYLKQVEFKDTMLELAQNVKFFAPESRQLLVDWINSVSIDWPISRRRYYATEVPLWYCKKCREPMLSKRGTYVQPWKDPAPAKSCPKCKSSEFEGETRVFDTWFDSSISPLYILGWDREQAFFETHKPCSLRPQGKDIVRTWLYYTLLKCYLLTDEAIFDSVWINHHIVDEKGNKMSKSVGNIIDPQEVIKRYGAEALRFWVAAEGNITQTDLRCSYQRIEGAGKTLTKLWNVARFVSMFPEPQGRAELSELDKWLLHEINELVKLCKEKYDQYDFHNPIVALRNFLWETFASHYLELCKNRAYNESGAFSKEAQNGALQTLHTCLDTLLRLFAPVIPIITSQIYEALWKKDVHQESFPDVKEDRRVPFTKEGLFEINSAVWKAKKDKGLTLKAEIAELVIPLQFKPIEHDLKIAHNAKKVGYADKIEVKL